MLITLHIWKNCVKTPWLAIRGALKVRLFVKTFALLRLAKDLVIELNVLKVVLITPKSELQIEVKTGLFICWFDTLRLLLTVTKLVLILLLTVCIVQFETALFAITFEVYRELDVEFTNAYNEVLNVESDL